MQRIIRPVLLLPDLDRDLGRAADADHRHVTGQLGEPPLERFTVIFAGGRLDLLAHPRNVRLYIGLGADAVDDRGVVLVDRGLLCPATRARPFRDCAVARSDCRAGDIAGTASC